MSDWAMSAYYVLRIIVWTCKSHFEILCPSVSTQGCLGAYLCVPLINGNQCEPIPADLCDLFSTHLYLSPGSQISQVERPFVYPCTQSFPLFLAFVYCAFSPPEQLLLFKGRGVACFYASPQVLLASPLSLDGDRMSDLGLISMQYSAFYNTVVGSYFFMAVHVNNSQFLYKRNAFFFSFLF